MQLQTTVMVAALFSLVAGCAGSPPGGSELAAANTENLRCKTMIKTGTRLGTKVCKTNAEWDREARDSREATESIQRTSTHGPGPEGS